MIIEGQCVCASVKYQIDATFKAFYLCHCKQCQRFSGSAFTAHIFTHPDKLRWLNGEDTLTRYAHQSRDFSNAFCATCGSPLPYVNKSGLSLVVPAGTLNFALATIPNANIFYAERACWLHDGLEARAVDGFDATS